MSKENEYNNLDEELEAEVNPESSEEEREVVDPWADLLFGRRRPRRFEENSEDNTKEEE